jgi:hypothetical protein
MASSFAEPGRSVSSRLHESASSFARLQSGGILRNNMPFIPFHQYFREIAEHETRTLKPIDPRFGLPPTAPSALRRPYEPTGWGPGGNGEALAEGLGLKSQAGITKPPSGGCGGDICEAAHRLGGGTPRVAPRTRTPGYDGEPLQGSIQVPPLLPGWEKAGMRGNLGALSDW